MKLGNLTQTQTFVLLWVMVGVLYALYAAVFLPPAERVSNVISEVFHNYPITAVVIGGLLVHWAWR